MRTLLIAVALFFGFCATASSAYQAFTLEGVNFADGGQATGTFVIDLDASNLNPNSFNAQIVAASIITTGGNQYSGTYYNGKNFGSATRGPDLFIFGAPSGFHDTNYVAFDNFSEAGDFEGALIFSFLSLSTSVPTQLLATFAYPGEEYYLPGSPYNVLSSYEWRTISSGNLVPSAVPSPIAGSGLPVLLMGLAGLIGWRRNRARSCPARRNI